MNLFKFFTSKAGKIVMGVPQALVLSASVGVFGTYAMWNVADKVNEPAAVRSISALQGGGHTTYGIDGRTSMNFKDALGQVRTEEEWKAVRAAEGGAPNDFGLGAIDNGSVANAVVFDNPYDVGQAAATGPSDGLGMGANKVTFIEGSAPVGGAAAQPKGVNPGAVSGAAPTPTGERGTAGSPQLAKASMARASGSTPGNVYQAAGAPSGSGGAGSRGAGASGDRHVLSGHMGAGSSAVASLSLPGSRESGPSGFMSAGRDSSGGKGRRAFHEKDYLKDIAKRSADAARNSTRSVNEGGRAFLEGGVNSGGMTIEGGAETTEGSSTDMSANERGKLKAVGNWAEKEDDYQERKDKARRRLAWTFLATLGIGIGLLYGAAAALKSLPKPWSYIVAGVCAAILLAGCLNLIFMANKYMSEFDGTVLPIMSFLASAALMAGMGMVFAMPGKAWKWLSTKFLKILAGYAVSVGLSFLSSQLMGNL